jgi:hypothetical protein
MKTDAQLVVRLVAVLSGLVTREVSRVDVGGLLRMLRWFGSFVSVIS